MFFIHIIPCTVATNPFLGLWLSVRSSKVKVLPTLSYVKLGWNISKPHMEANFLFSPASPIRLQMTVSKCKNTKMMYKKCLFISNVFICHYVTAFFHTLL